MRASRPSAEQVWGWLAELPDPELPVVSLTELGIVREVRWQEDTLVVAVTPTYSGCPAVAVIDAQIESCLRGKGIEKLSLERRLSPAWTSDWLSPSARARLEAYGIAPPLEDGASAGPSLSRPSRARRLAGPSLAAVPCPRCASTDTEKLSHFGSTPCKATFRCRRCLEPFDYFKCI